MRSLKRTPHRPRGSSLETPRLNGSHPKQLYSELRPSSPGRSSAPSRPVRGRYNDRACRVRRDGHEAAPTQEFQLKVAIFHARLFAYLQRFSVACDNFGIVSAIRLFYYCRFKSFPSGVSLRVRKLRRAIVFRGRTDKGVMSHFFKPGYRILDTVDNPVLVIVDAGANIGDETLRFRHFHPHARIVAIEP